MANSQYSDTVTYENGTGIISYRKQSVPDNFKISSFQKLTEKYGTNAEVASNIESGSSELAQVPHRRASFPFVPPDLPTIPKLESVPEHWHGIYSSVLFPPKSHGNHTIGQVEGQIIQNGQPYTYMQPIFCADITSSNFNGYFDGKNLNMICNNS